MNWKIRNRAVAVAPETGTAETSTKETSTKETSTKETSTKETLSFKGGGKISVSVESIVNSPKVQRQVTGVREIAANQMAVKRK